MENIRSSEIRRFDYIDSLRGLAIIMVVIAHVIQPISHPPRALAFFASKGVYGVQLFFIVSALTLFLSYSQRQSRDGSSTNLFFFIRRFFRIAPTFYLAIGFYALMLLAQTRLLTGSIPGLNVLNLIIYALFLSLFYPPSMTYLPFGGWTVHVEMLFYLFIPWLFHKIFSLRRAIIFFFLALLVSQILDKILHARLGSYYDPYFWFWDQLPVFAVGIICFLILKAGFLKASSRAGLVLFVFSLGWISAMLFLCRQYSFLPEHILVALGLGAFTVSLSVSRVRLLENRLTRFFGEISYSLYLWHFAIVNASWYFYKKTSHFHELNPILAFCLILAFTLLAGSFISWITYYFLERRGIAWGKALIMKLSARKQSEVLEAKVI